MASGRRVWVVATSMGAVEALKDQGFCRWNYGIRCLEEQAKKNLGLCSQVKRFSSSITGRSRDKMIQQSEESLRKVMYLSCWGSN